MVLAPASVTAPGVVANILPSRRAFGPRLLVPVRATTLPANVVPPIVAELPTCHQTLQACAPLISEMFDVEIVVSELDTLKM